MAEWNLGPSPQTTTDVSGTLYDSGGQLDPYQNGEDYTFLISRPAESITLRFEYLHTELNYDHLKVFDGTDDLGVALHPGSGWNGDLAPSPVTATSGNMFIRFTSDGSQQRPGFKVSWGDAPVPPTPTPPQYIPGIIGWWPADDEGTITSADVSGNGNDAATGLSIGYADGEVNKAFSFAGGAGNIATVFDDTVLNPTSITIEGWVYFVGTGSGRTAILSKGVLNSTTNISYTLMVDYPSNDLYFKVKDTDGNVLSLIGGPLEQSTFIHLAATYDETTGEMKLYKNGALLNSALFDAFPIQTVSNSLFIGGLDVDGVPVTWGMIGRVDEITLYDRAISLSEAQAIYNAGPNGKQLNPSASSSPSASPSTTPSSSTSSSPSTTPSSSPSPSSGPTEDITMDYPQCVEYDITQNALWAGSSNGFIRKFNAATGSQIGSDIIVTNPYRLAYDILQNAIWTISRDDPGYLIKYNAATGAIIGSPISVMSYPIDVVYDSTQNAVWVLGESEMQKFNASTGAHIQTVTLSGHPDFAYALSFIYDVTQNLIWVSVHYFTASGDGLRRYNALTGASTGTEIALSDECKDLIFDSVHNVIWLITINDPTLVRFDASTGIQVGSPYSFLSLTHTIAYDIIRNLVLVTIGNSPNISIYSFSPSTGDFIEYIDKPLFINPVDNVYDPTNSVWIVDDYGGMIWKIEGATPTSSPSSSTSSSSSSSESSSPSSSASPSPGPDGIPYVEEVARYGEMGHEHVPLITTYGYLDWTLPADLSNVPAPIVEEVLCEEAVITHAEFWPYLTTFWNYLMDEDRGLFENYWTAMTIVGDSLIKKARRFYEAIHPENSRLCVLDDYYDFQVGPMFSKPLYLDPTLKNENYTIIPVAKYLIEPQYDGFTSIYRDMIEISATDYYKIREVGLDDYVVIKVKNDTIADKYFKIFNLLSSEEPVNRKAYAELDSYLNDTTNPNIINPNEDEDVGTIALEGLCEPGTTIPVDISQNKVKIVESDEYGYDPTTLEWTTDELIIKVQSGGQIQSIRKAAETPLGTPWGEIQFFPSEGETPFGDPDLKAVALFGVVAFTSPSYEIDELANYHNTFSTDGIIYGDVDASKNDPAHPDIVNPNPNIDVGTIRIHSIPSVPVDIHNRDVQILESGNGGTDPTTVTWTGGAVIIRVKTRERSTKTQIEKIMDAYALAPGAWATLTDINATKGKAPIMGPDEASTGFIKVGNLPSFRIHEFENGRYYPASGSAWVWFEGYSSTNGTEGNPLHGEYVDDPSKRKYVIVVDGDLSYIGDNSFSFYLTTGRSYDIMNYVTSIPTLQSQVTSEAGPEFRVDLDYTFRNQILEFKKDPLLDTLVNGSYLYHPKTPIIEHMLFETYGNMVNISDWLAYNYNNESGKAGVNALMSSMQNSSSREDYERAFNVYYGLPIAPDTCEVTGLYESYGYKLLAIDGNQLTLEISTEPTDEELSPFIQVGARLMAVGKSEVIISSITDRSAGTLEVVDSSGLVVGDMLSVKLINRYHIKNIYAETETTPAYIEIYSNTNHESIAHIISIISAISGGSRYPEILIYGTSKSDVNYDGIYHITAADAASYPGIVRLHVYKRTETTDPLYNDFIGTTSENMGAGFVHIPWPTHKFLYLLLNGERYFKAYLDSPMDTIYEEGDKLEKYQVLARNASVLTRALFPNWNQFDNFRKFNGLNYESDMLELTKGIVGAEFGEYFPSRYKET